MKLTGARRSNELEGRMREGIKRVRRGENPSEYAHILIGPGRPCAMLGEDGLCLLQKEGGHVFSPGKPADAGEAGAQLLRRL